MDVYYPETRDDGIKQRNNYSTLSVDLKLIEEIQPELEKRSYNLLYPCFHQS